MVEIGKSPDCFQLFFLFICHATTARMENFAVFGVFFFISFCLCSWNSLCNQWMACEFLEFIEQNNEYTIDFLNMGAVRIDCFVIFGLLHRCRIRRWISICKKGILTPPVENGSTPRLFNNNFTTSSREYIAATCRTLKWSWKCKDKKVKDINEEMFFFFFNQKSMFCNGFFLFEFSINFYHENSSNLSSNFRW